MRLFNWHLIPHDELKALQHMSAQDIHVPLRGHGRFDNPELKILAQQMQESRSNLLAEIQHLNDAEAALQTELSAARKQSDARAEASAETTRKAARIEHMQTDFIAAASHELKTPLAGIEALGDALQMAMADGNLESAHEFITHIKAETKRMRTLTEELLDLSRFDENPDSDSVSNLRNAIERASIMPLKTAKSQGISFKVNIADNVSDIPLAKISPTDLSIILDNLLDNALHHTSAGSITISLSADSDSDGSNGSAKWLLTVTDTGTGIAESDQQRVFDRFYTVDRSRSRDYGGTGLGLSLVKKAAERWKGAVYLESELDKGSSFTVEIPAA